MKNFINKNKSLLINLALLLGTILILIFIAEITLRFFYKPLNSGWGWNDSPRRDLSNEVNDYPNQLGLRGQKIKYDSNDFVILILGDSQVEAATSLRDKMPEILLENDLNVLNNRPVKVFSLAASGWGQDQQLIALEKYFKSYRADLILIWATPKNDFWENTFPDRNVGILAGHLKPTFKILNNELDGPYYQGNSYYKHSSLLQLFFTALQNYKKKTIEQLILDDWYYELPKPHKRINNNHVKSFEIDLNKYSENILQLADSNNITILTYENFIDGRSHFSPYIIPNSPRDKYSIQITKLIYSKINEICKLNKAEMFVFYPIRNDFDIVNRNCVKYVKSYYHPENYFKVDLNFIDKIKAVVPNENLLTFQIAGGDDICVDFKDRHLNDLGNERVMKNLANFISVKFLN